MPCKLCYVAGVCSRVGSGMGGPDNVWLSRIDNLKVSNYQYGKCWEILYELPFGNLTDLDLENSYSASKERIVQLMENHGMYDFIKPNHFSDLFNNQDIPECGYFSEDDFIRLKRDAPSNLNIFSMNIRSLPKHGGELTVF